MEELRLELHHLTFDRLSQIEPERVSAAQAALTFYSVDGYLSINSAFRRVYSGIPVPVLDEDQRRVATFLHAIEPAVIEAPFPLLVYRGVGRTEGRRIFEALERGEGEFEFTFPMSVSWNDRVARRFSNRFETPRGEREIMLYITIPQRTRLVFVEPFSTYPDEDEILILPRTRLIFDNVDEHPLLRLICIRATAMQETLPPLPDAEVDETLVWHWQLCTGVAEEEEEGEEGNELFEIQEELCEEF